VNVEDEKAFEMSRQLARVEGLFVGMSSGAAMVAALNEAAAMETGSIVAILPDSGERYLSTPLFAVQEKASVNLFNMLNREKEPFNPLTPHSVTMYTCGPTAHARMNLSECRRLVAAELLRKYLDFRGFKVNHVVHVTDLDDKTIEGAEKAGLDLSRFTQQQMDGIKKDLAFLGIEPADEYPKTSDHVPEMIRMSEDLVKKGFAYEKLRSLYFDLTRLPDYGKLSGIDVNKIRIGATVDLDEYEKDNPRDFTLLKRTTLSELRKGIFFKTPWGNVRPSWHIQSAAIARKYLGQQFDIHTSSRELAFPHHENEIAISTALTGKGQARYWVLCERVLVDDGDKVGAATELTLETLTEMGFSDREIRYWLISGHYRKPITFSKDRLEHARRSLKRFDTCIERLKNISEGDSFPEISQLIYDLKQNFTTAMDEDLNISAALASTFKVVKRINQLITEKRLDAGNARSLIDAFRKIDAVLKIFDFSENIDNAKVQALLEKRREARTNGNWKLADRIRDELVSMGVQVRDEKLK